MSFMVVNEYERIVVSSRGRVKTKNPRGPGFVFYWPCFDEIRVVDIRTMICQVPRQEILTKDSVTVLVDAVVFHRVENPVKALNNVEDYKASTRLLAASTLRNVLGTQRLDELLENREEIAKNIESGLRESTKKWGTKVERVEITDIQLPETLQESMAAEAEATRKGKASQIASQGEAIAAKALAEASHYLAQNPMTIELRYLQTLAEISHDSASTIVFPFPVDVIQGFMK